MLLRARSSHARERAARVVVIADGSKIGGAGNAVVAEAGSIQTLVTDRTAPTLELTALAAAGVEIVIAGPNDDAPGAASGRTEPA